MTDIAELFARDPMQLSEQDLDQIIRAFREMRGQFNLGAKAAGSTKPKTEKQIKENAFVKSLGELDLDI